MLVGFWEYIISNWSTLFLPRGWCTNFSESPVWTKNAPKCVFCFLMILGYFSTLLFQCNEIYEPFLLKSSILKILFNIIWTEHAAFISTYQANMQLMILVTLLEERKEVLLCNNIQKLMFRRFSELLIWTTMGTSASSRWWSSWSLSAMRSRSPR